MNKKERLYTFANYFGSIRVTTVASTTATKGVYRTFLTEAGKLYRIKIRNHYGALSKITVESWVNTYKLIATYDNLVGPGETYYTFRAISNQTDIRVFDPSSSTASTNFTICNFVLEEVEEKNTYRFGFNGKENDNETQTQDYGMRIYDYRLSRFLSVDPITVEYPELTPYQFANNKPIESIDLDGLEDWSSKDGKQALDEKGKPLLGPLSAGTIKKYNIVPVNAPIIPIKGNEEVFISDDYGDLGKRRHNGIDLVYKKPGAIKGAEVVSPVDGTIVVNNTTGSDGNGGGVRTRIKDKEGDEYALYHMEKNSNGHLKVTQKIKKGEKVGTVGNTGSPAKKTPNGNYHLHLEVWNKGKKSDRVNPKIKIKKLSDLKPQTTKKK